MVKIATGFGRNGLQDWLIQRITAVILAVYSAFILSRLFATSQNSYEAWRELFVCGGVRAATLLALLSLIAHAWIGLWTVTTDYLKPLALRLLIQIAIILSLFGYFLWAIKIIWGF